MSDASISGLPAETNPIGADIVPLVHDGETRKTTLLNFIKGLPVVSGISKGLMSIGDKINLDTVVTKANNLETNNSIYTQTIASATTINIAASIQAVRLTGSTEVVNVNTPEVYRVIIVHYPSGPGLVFQGTPMSAGSALLIITTPSS